MTGVQTCALPICGTCVPSSSPTRTHPPNLSAAHSPDPAPAAPHLPVASPPARLSSSQLAIPSRTHPGKERGAAVPSRTHLSDYNCLLRAAAKKEWSSGSWLAGGGLPASPAGGGSSFLCLFTNLLFLKALEVQPRELDRHGADYRCRQGVVFRSGD